MNRRFFFLVSLTFVILLGVAVRASHLSHPMRYDESYNYLHYVSHGPRHIITHYVPNNHILHSLSVWAAGRVAGHSPAALRIPAFLAGILLIPATAWLAWVVSRRVSVALLSGLAICCSSALIEYSVNARGYSMLALFAVLAALSLFHALQLPQYRRRWIYWGAIGAAGMYTVPIMAMPFMGMTAVCAVAAAVSPDTNRRDLMLRGLGFGSAICIVVTVLAYLPILMVGGLEVVTKSQDLAYELLGAQISSPLQMIFTTSAFWTRHAPLFLVIGASLGMLVFLLRTVRACQTGRLILVGSLLLPLLAAIAASAPMPARTWLFAVPFLFIMAAQGLAEISVDSNRMRRICGQGMQLMAVLGLVIALGNVWKSDYLCCEPRGLVLVEPALQECQSYGAFRCALVSPYTPAAAYYKSRTNTSPLVDAASPDAHRVYVLSSNDRSLDELWRPGVKGYELYSHPHVLWERPGGRLYVAERADRNALR